jgi:carbonic anhydrase
MPDSILKKYTEQQKKYFQLNQAHLQKLVEEGQQPEVLFIACSDSRIMVEGLLGLKAGEFFIYRNIAACVPPFNKPDLGTTAVLEFAVMALKIKHIIVCGHTDCGGIIKADSPPDSDEMPAVARWLDYVQPACHHIDTTLPNLSPKERHHAIVEQHVINQLTNLRSFPFIQEAENQGKLSLHGWIKDLMTQTLRAYDPPTQQFASPP